MILSLHHDLPESESSFARFETASVLKSLKALDSRARRKGLDALDPARGALIPIGMEIEGERVVKNGYGVFNLAWQVEKHPEWAGKIAAELDELRVGIKIAHPFPGKGLPVKFLIWVGMGGSAEDKAMYQALGLLRRGPRLYLLDSTDPVKLDSIIADMKKRSGLPHGFNDGDLLRHTLVVGMAMGMTSFEPVVNLKKLAAMYDAAGIDSRRNFYYMTFPGSLLDRFAAGRGYRRVPLQLDEENSTAGRHSAPMNRGSLYPLGLAGVNLREWMEGTLLSKEEVDAAWRLASFLHVQSLVERRQSRDKVTLLLPRKWTGAGIWTKQDFEESLGKSAEYGLKIVIGERVRLTNYRAPKDPWQDRVFWCVQLKGTHDACVEKLALLRRAGYPVASLTLPMGTTLSHYMQFVHYVVFGLAWLRKINFVTQPNVELYKAIANKLYAESEKAGGVAKTKQWRQTEESPRKSVWRGRVTLRWDRLPEEIQPQEATAPGAYAALLKHFTVNRQATYGELTFFGDTRYSVPGRALRAVLDRAAERLFRARLKMPVDVYEGPAMNHSYHEMIIGHGGCFSTILIAESREPADYHRAQYLATQMALAERGRAVVSIALRDLEESSLRALDEFFRQAATQIRQAK